MSQKDEYSTSEWALLIRALIETAGTMMVASPGGIVGETVATYQALNEVGAKHKGIALIDSLVASMANMTAEEREALQSQERGIRAYEEVKRGYLNQLRQARFILAEKATPEEADAYKDAVLYLAERVAKASKEGGFFFIGGTRYTESEQELVQAIEEVLDVEQQ